MNADQINKEFKTAAKKLQRQAKATEESFDVNYEAYKNNIEKGLNYFINAMFPGYAGKPEEPSIGEDIETHYLRGGYTCMIKVGLAEEKALELVRRIPSVYKMLQEDVVAAYRGDPAAKSVDEIILAYPAFLAIAAYRVAHELYLMKESVIARLMTEYAHRKTGIDIHPGATIGKRFFIDHGTGVVIGETTTIGHDVKLYQHVTLGAKSFDTAPDGSLVKGIKRHPDIGNNVVIYSGATILGGDTKIGNNCVIGGNVWLTESVVSGETVLARPGEHIRINKEIPISYNFGIDI